MGCESNGSKLLCTSSCKLGKSLSVQPLVNGIPSRIRLSIVSAMSDVCGSSNSTWSDNFNESTFMRYGLTGITLNDKAHILHSCSQLVRNQISMRMNCPRTRPIIWMNQMHGSRLTTLIEGRCGTGDTSALIYLTHVVIMPLFIIVSGKLTADVNVNTALQIGEACMEALEKNHLRVSIIK